MLIQITDGPTTTVLLDLSPSQPVDTDTGVITTDQFSAPPPPLRRQILASALRDGGIVNNQSFDLRTIELPLAIHKAAAAAAADPASFRRTAVTTLMRLISQERFWLRVRVSEDAAAESRWLHCYKAADASLTALLYQPHAVLALTVLADPFAYGLKETITPALSTNEAGLFVATIAAAATKGDVPCPLLLTYSIPTPGADYMLIVGSRTGLMPHHTAVEIDQWSSSSAHTNPANAAAMGSALASVVMAASDIVLLQSAGTSYPAVALRPGQTDSSRLPGTYRAFLVYGMTGADGNQVKITLYDQFLNVLKPIQTVTRFGSALKILDLGLIQHPGGSVQATDPLTGSQLTTAVLDLALDIYAVQAQTFLYDTLLMFPADESLLLWKSNDSGYALYKETIDPYTGGIVVSDSGGAVAVGIRPSYVGAPPLLTPGRDLNLVAAKFAASGSGWSFNRSTAGIYSLSASFYPQYLTVL